MYNVELYIRRCAESLFEQSFKDVEYIFVDDCSQDNTIALLNEVIDQYHVSEKVTLERFDENKGLAATRWRGLQLARGEYVAQVDSDDHVTNDYIEMLLGKAEIDNSDIVICDYVYEHATRCVVCHENPPTDKSKCFAKLMSGELRNAVWNKLIRRELYVKHDIHPVPGINMFEDKTVMFQLFYYCKKVSYVGKPLYYYNRTNANSIVSQDKLKLINPSISVIKIIRTFFDDKQLCPEVKRGIEFFIVGVMGHILLYGSKGIIEKNKDLIGKPTISNILLQPVIPFYYKLIVLAYRCHLNFLIPPIKNLIGWVRHFRY